MFAGHAMALDPIVGNWTTKKRTTAVIEPCGSGLFVTLKTGQQYAGKQIGSLSNNGKRYVGKITDPANDTTYIGKASLSGNTQKIGGCVWADFSADRRN